MLTRETIEQAARDYGATVFGVGGLALFAGEDPKHDPKMICPRAQCIVGFGIPVPRGLYKTMKDGSQFYTYTTVGVKAIDEEYFEMFLFRMASVIEDEGYDACLQRPYPNMRVQGDTSANPETIGVYELKFASPVEPGKPPPDVMIDFGKAARACGFGQSGLYGRVINRDYGPMMRYAFVITDAPLEANAPWAGDLCAECRRAGGVPPCAAACTAACIDPAKGLDTWKCWEHYNKARGYTLPRTQWGYQACLCGRRCDIACYEKLAGRPL